MCVNNLPKVATQWNSGTTRESNPCRRARIPPSALTTKPLSHTKQWLTLTFAKDAGDESREVCIIGTVRLTRPATGGQGPSTATVRRRRFQVQCVVIQADWRTQDLTQLGDRRTNIVRCYHILHIASTICTSYCTLSTILLL